MSDFDSLWKLIQKKVKSGEDIPNWTRKQGCNGKVVHIISTDENGVLVETFNGRAIYVRKDDFKTVWGVWPSYLRGIVKRNEIRDMVWTSVYVISILKFVD